MILLFIRLSDHSIKVFSSHINSTHLRECIDQLLHLYSETEKVDLDTLLQTDWFKIEALHVLLAPNATGLYRAFQLPPIAISQRVIKYSVEISTSLWLGNFVRAHRTAARLPLILQLAYRMQFAKQRPTLLKVYDKSYRSAQGGRFPLDKLRRHLMFSSIAATSNYCREFGLLVDGSSVLFKTSVTCDEDGTSKSQDIYCRDIEEQLKNVCLADLLHGKSLWVGQRSFAGRRSTSWLCFASTR